MLLLLICCVFFVVVSSRLLLGLAWYADAAAELVAVDGKQAVQWHIKWAQPASLAPHNLAPIALRISSSGSVFSYEERCHAYEALFSSSDLNIVCRCCDEEIGVGPCDACRYAVGFHVCPKSGVLEHRWRRATLFGGVLDIQRCLYNLHRRMLPSEVLRSKAQEYVDAGLVSESMAQVMIRTIEAERGAEGLVNENLGSGVDMEGIEDQDRPLSKLNTRQLSELLQTREKQMRHGGGEGHETDQWRVYCEIVEALAGGRYLRMMVQDTPSICVYLMYFVC